MCCVHRLACKAINAHFVLYPHASYVCANMIYAVADLCGCQFTWLVASEVPTEYEELSNTYVGFSS